MIRLNNKDLWSVLKYTGETNEFHLTHGRAYYWPCTKEDPYFRGIVDDEEFTNYLYDVYGSCSDDWIILDDPTGMAYRTLNNNRLTENELIKSVAQNLSEKQKMLICEEMDIPYVFTIGDEKFYNRFGFEDASKFGLKFNDVEIKAFVDTGNSIKDPVTSLNVIFI